MLIVPAAAWAETAIPIPDGGFSAKGPSRFEFLGHWLVSQQPDSETGELTYAVGVMLSLNGPEIVLTCTPSIPRVMVTYRGRSSTSQPGQRAFAYRFDEAQAVTAPWYYDGDVVLIMDDEAQAFIAELGRHSRLYTRAIDDAGRPEDQTFDLTDAPAAIAHLREVCASGRWTAPTVPLAAGPTISMPPGGVSAKGRSKTEIHGLWSLNHKPDAITDELTYNAALRPESGRRLLMISCTPSTAELTVSIHNDAPLTSRTLQRALNYRLDDAPAVTSTWWYDGDLVELMDDEARPFITKLSGGNRLRARATDATGRPVDFEFDLTGVMSVFARMRVLCAGGR